jgi:copper(I)-binding protein
MKKTLLSFISLAIVGAASSLPAMAADTPKSTIAINHVYGYPTAAPGVTAAGYLTLTNTGKKADTLLDVQSPQTDSIEIHEMSMAGGVMKMRALDKVPLPAGKTVALAPGGFHLMLFSPSKALVVGDHVPLTLHFAKAGKVAVDLLVEARPEQ